MDSMSSFFNCNSGSPPVKTIKGIEDSPAGQRFLIILKKKENVIFVGSKLPKELPNYIASFDVGIIPFVKNEFTKNIYPLKINEYLAAGVGVVSTNFAVLTEFENMAIITDEHSLFVKAILENSQNQGEEVKEERQEMAKQNSWENRGDLLAKIIYDYQDSKK